jgi:hypothetical protein
MSSIERFTFKTFCINKLGENKNQDNVIKNLFENDILTINWKTYKIIENKLRIDYIEYINNLPDFK